MQAVERALARALEQPYPGLRPFEPFESFLFFGRKTQTQDLLEQLSANRFIAVVGESGSGKSSLVRAGLLPHLYRGYLTGTTSQWRIAILRPGSNPLDEMASALSDRQVLGPAEGMREELGRSSRGLLTCVRNAKLAPGESLLILVDQFEELFRFERERRVKDSGAEASLFVTSLLEAVGAYGSPVYVVITMRSDYLGECSRFQGLPEALNRSQYLVPRLTREQKQECIESPAAIGGAKLTPRLVQLLLNDVGDDPDHLPVLQHALMRMFQVWAKAGRQGEIDLEHYLHEEVGGMTQALNHHADSIYEEFSADEQEWVRRVFRCLTTEESGRLIRRPARLDRLYMVTGADTADEQELVNRIIRKFLEPENALLVVSTPGRLDADTVIDISHESLIRKWTVLREWVREEGQSAEWYRSVVRDVERNQKGDAGLWRDPNLARALERWERDGWNAEWARQYWPREQPSFQEVTAFLELSSRTQQAEREKEEARRQEEIQTERELRETAEARAKAEREAAAAARRTSRIVAVGSLAMLVAAAAFSLFLLHSRRQAQSRQYAAQALLALPRNPESALRTAVSAGEAAETLEAERALSSVLDQAVPALVVRAGNAVQEARFTADGNRIVTVSTLGVQQEWDAHSGAPAGRDIRVRGEAPTSPDGSRSVAPAENDGVSRLRDKALGRVIELRGHSGRVLSAGFSPDSTKVVTAGVDGTARTFDALTGRPLRTFVGHTLGIQHAEFSRDGRKVVTASDDGTAIVWDVETGQAIAQALAHSRPILWAEFSPDGSRIATASSDQTARIWDIDGGARQVRVGTRFARVATTLMELRGHSQAVYQARFSADGERVVTAGLDGTARIWESRPRGEVRGHAAAVVSAQFAEHGRALMIADRDGVVTVRDSEGTGPPVKLAGMAGQICCALSPDGKRLVTTDKHGAIRIVDTSSGQELKRFRQAPAEDLAAGFVFYGRTLLVKGGGQARLLDAESGAVVNDFGGRRVTFAASVFEDPNWVVTLSSEDSLVLLWEERGKAPLLELAGHSRPQYAVCTNDGKRLLTMDTSAARLFDTSNGRKTREIKQPGTGSLEQAMVSERGDRILTVSSDSTIRLWNSDSGDKPLIEIREGGRVTQASFVPGDRRILTVSGPDAHIWDAASGLLIHAFTNPYGSVGTADPTSKGDRLFVGGEGGYARIHEVTLPALLGIAKNRPR